MTSTEKSSKTIFVIIMKRELQLQKSAQVISDVDQIMQYDNAIDYLLTML